MARKVGARKKDQDGQERVHVMVIRNGRCQMETRDGGKVVKSRRARRRNKYKG